jgi:signal transduction histidine kinase
MDGEQINISGRQRMLTQKYVKEILLVKQGVFDRSIIDVTQKRVIENFDHLNSLLIMKDTSSILHKKNIINHVIYKYLTESRNSFVKLAEAGDLFLSERSGANDPIFINSITEKNTELQEQLNEVVNLYIKRYNNKITIYNFWIIILFIIIFLLCLLIIFLFYKSSKQHETLIHEIDKKERVEENQRTLLYKLERINDKLTDFAYITSHDLKSPLINLSGLLDLINEDLKKEKY